MKRLRIVILQSMIGLMLPLATSAQSKGSLLPACIIDGVCTTCDMIQMFVNLYGKLLNVVSVFAVLMFFVGGIFWIVSGGNQERIARGRLMMISSLIGILLVFLSFNVVNLMIAASVGQARTDLGNVKLKDGDGWTQHWAEYCKPTESAS